MRGPPSGRENAWIAGTRIEGHRPVDTGDAVLGQALFQDAADRDVRVAEHDAVETAELELVLQGGNDGVFNCPVSCRMRPTRICSAVTLPLSIASITAARSTSRSRSRRCAAVTFTASSAAAGCRSPPGCGGS